MKGWRSSGSLRGLAALAVKSLFRRAGLEVHSYGGTRATMAQALAHLRARGLAPATVVDVGAASGTEGLYEAFPDARLVLVEPLAEFEPALRRIARRYRAEYVQAAAGSRNGSVTLHVKPRLTGSSVFPERAARATAAATPRCVPLVTLDTLRDRLGLPGPFLLKLDVEGAELDVLDGAQKVLEETDAVLLEVTFIARLQGAPEFARVVGSMDAAGFSVYDLFGLRCRKEDGALFQADAVFVRHGSRLRGG